MSLHVKCYEEFRMLWFSAEKKTSIFFEFFNRIGRRLPLARGSPASAFGEFRDLERTFLGVESNFGDIKLNLLS